MLRFLSEYTAWSRDLALAAGASDADAVRTNFDDDRRHTREYYMLKQVVSAGYKVHKHMPQFMLPKCIKPKGFIDEAETLYVDGRRGGAGGEGKDHGSILGSMVRRAAGEARPPLTGEEAREEMSVPDSKDLEGPVSPALAPSLQKQATEEKPGSKKGDGAAHGPGKAEPAKRKSLASKAKNFPFQQQ